MTLTQTAPQWRRPPAGPTRKVAWGRQKDKTLRQRQHRAVPSPPWTGRGVPRDGGEGTAQGTVDVGYKCVWRFPNKGGQGAWEATVTRAGDLHGNVVACAVSKFTKAKWLHVYSGGREPPCQWGKATPLQKKEACKLYLESHMDALLSEPPQEAS